MVSLVVRKVASSENILGLVLFFMVNIMAWRSKEGQLSLNQLDQGISYKADSHP